MAVDGGKERVFISVIINSFPTDRIAMLLEKMNRTKFSENLFTILESFAIIDMK